MKSMMEEMDDDQDMDSNVNPENGNGKRIGKGMGNLLPHQTYSIPGILHFIQHEWSRFEMERAQWEVEKAELQARIAFLQGERKGQENLKRDLVRRIKMLEYALRQERAKFLKLKHGTENMSSEIKEMMADTELTNDQLPPGSAATTGSGASWKEGRQLLRQYLQEIGYTDTIIDVRSQRVRALLGLQGAADGDKEQTVKRTRQTSAKITGGKGDEAVLNDTENSVLAVFDFLQSSDVSNGRSDGKHFNSQGGLDADHSEVDGGGADDADTEEALAEFDFLTSEGMDEHLTSEEWKMPTQMIGKLKKQYQSERRARKPPQRIKRSPLQLQSMLQSLGPDEEEESLSNARYDNVDSMGIGGQHTNENDLESNMLGLGELADLTVNNDNTDAVNYELSLTKEALPKTWTTKYTLRSHFDSVQALAFDESDPILISASDDHTLKMWNLEKTSPGKKNLVNVDIEPVYTFRGHAAPVLSVVVDSRREQCFSGGLDGAIFCWHLPSSMDMYECYDPTVLITSITDAHADGVWGLSLYGSKLVSCGADGLVKLWSPGSSTPDKAYCEEMAGSPTCVEFCADPCHLLTSFSSGHAYVIDIETGKTVVDLQTDNGSFIYKIISHPTLPICFTSHDNGQIKFFDTTSGKLIHAMVAHLDAVSSLAVEPNGLYLLSGSHDCSIRMWNLESKTCVQEITAHRKKFDASVNCVAFHPDKPYIASGGADAIIKVHSFSSV